MGSIASVVGGVAGGVGGFMLGGPAGAAVGFSAGSALGGMAGGNSGGGKGGSSANMPSVDPNISASQNQLNQFSSEYLNNWKTNIWPELQKQSQLQQARSDEQYAVAKGIQDQNLKIAQGQADIFQNQVQPLQSSIISDAMNYDTAANRERMAALAIGDVKTSAATNQATMERNMAGYGINPTSGRYAGMSNANALLQSAQESAAANRARAAAEQLGWDKKLAASTVGQNIFNNQVTAAGTGLTAGTVGLNYGQIPINNFNSMTASGATAYGLPIQATNQVGNLGLGTYQAQVGAANAQNQANATTSAGYGSALGTVAGVGLKYGLDKGWGSTAAATAPIVA